MTSIGKNKPFHPMDRFKSYFSLKPRSSIGILVIGFIILIPAAIFILIDLIPIAIVFGALGAILICVACIQNPHTGFYMCFLVSWFLLFPERLLNNDEYIPIGLVPEFFSYLAWFGIIVHKQYRDEADKKFWKNAIFLWMFVLLAFYVLQFFNPNMESKLGWFNFFRKQISYALFMYLAYTLLNSRKLIFRFTTLWIIVSSIHALYACKQQWFWFFDFEWQWVTSDIARFHLYVIDGFARKFGLVSDPAAAGVLYSGSFIFILSLAIREKTLIKRLLYGLLSLINLLASGYTGTRTGTLMIIAGAVFYCVLTLNEKRTLYFSVAFVIFLMGVILLPVHDNKVLTRVRTIFQGSNDPSAFVRDVNRKTVQPYVYTHLVGGGIFTSGALGEKYNPGHYLNSIPPDSGYLQAMMEQGPLGLALLLIFYFLILKTGIRHFYRVKEPEVKTLYVAYLTATFTMMVAQFSQMAIGQYPSVLFFYTTVIILIKLHRYDGASIS